jgi:hypothetical protein
MRGCRAYSGAGEKKEMFLLAPALLIALTVGAGSNVSQSFTGNWHLDLHKTRWSSSRPGSVVVVIYQKGPEFQYHGAVTYSGEDTRVFGFTGAFDGKPYRMSRSYGDGWITLKRVDARTFDSVFKSDDGSFTESVRTALSPDGKTLTRKLTLKGPDGSSTWVEVYDRR